MLASLSCAPGGWLAVVGRAASPSEKTARINIIPQVQEEVKRGPKITSQTQAEVFGPSGAPLQPVPGVRPIRAGCRPVRDSTLVAWYSSVYAPRTGGAYDGHHRTARVAGRTRWRGCRVAAAGPRAARRRAPAAPS